jgi:hypothetical protein
MCYYVFSLELKCRFFWGEAGGVLYVDASCIGNLPPGVRVRADLTAIPRRDLTILPTFLRKNSAHVIFGM